MRSTYKRVLEAVFWIALGHASSCSKHRGVKLGSSGLQSDSDSLLDRRVRAVCTVEKKRLTR